MFKYRISLVIPAFNEEKYLPACLKSVMAHAASDLDEIIVVDNASTDKTVEVARSFAGVKVVHEPQKSLARARQRGFLEARGEIIAYIDADTLIPPGWVTQIDHAFSKIPNLVCLSGPCVFYDFSSVKKLLTELYWRLLARPTSWLTGYLAIGGNLVIKKSALEQVGGFNIQMDFYGDDTEIARRLAGVGRVTFRQKFFLHTSARRLRAEGFLKMAWRYTLNFLSVVFTQKAFTKQYRDVR